MRTMGTPLARAVRAMGTRALTTERADVVVVGGGVAGAALACALRANPVTGNLSVTVVDGNAIDARAPVEGADARCVALTPRSRAFLEHRCGGAWSAMEATGRAGAFSRMQAWDGVGGGHVSYDAGGVGSATSAWGDGARAGDPGRGRAGNERAGDDRDDGARGEGRGGDEGDHGD